MFKSLALLLAALLLAACSTGTGSGTNATSGEMRTILVTMNDSLRFDPAAFTVQAGETVHFEVTNAGELRHDFFIGDEVAQADHEMEMAGHDMPMDTANSLSVEPGDTESLDYTFPDHPGELLIGCHERGHYAAGMVASITIGG